MLCCDCFGEKLFYFRCCEGKLIFVFEIKFFEVMVEGSFGIN